VANVFISYASPDLSFAEAVAERCEAEGLSVFLAPVSIEPGGDWADEIHEALRASPWVIFLASKAAISSPYVLQEIGAAIIGQKRFVPVVWDVSPEDLPGWAGRFQAVDLRHQSPEDIGAQLASVAVQIREARDRGFLLGAGLVGGFLWLLSRGDGASG
jgi:hypothetical protein